jgi:hypothetical protein
MRKRKWALLIAMLGILSNVAWVEAAGQGKTINPEVRLVEDAALLGLEPGLLRAIYQRSAELSGRSVQVVPMGGQKFYLSYEGKVYWVIVNSDPFVMMSRIPDPGEVRAWEKERIKAFLLDGADFQTFQELSDGFVKDREQVYYLGKVVPDADAATFEVLNKGYAKDERRVYRYTRGFPSWVRRVATDGNIAVVSEADSATFEIVQESAGMSDYESLYGKDREQVYFDGIVLPEAKPNSFRVLVSLLGGYGKDEGHVYFQAGMLAEADVATFAVLNPEYGKDKNAVYRRGERIEGADAATFEIIDHEFNRDKNRVYRKEKPIQGIDSESFQPLWVRSHPLCYKDKDAVYWDDEKVKGADAASFVLLENRYGQLGPYGKDRKRVYYREQVVPKADLATFEMLGDTNYGADKERLYDQGEPVGSKDISYNYYRMNGELMAANRPDLVIKYLSDLISRKESNYSRTYLYELRGDAHHLLNQTDSAINDYASALKSFTYESYEKADIHRKRGKLSLKSGKYTDAMADVEALREMDQRANPNRQGIYSFYASELAGEIYEAQGEYRKALEEYRRIYDAIEANDMVKTNPNLEEQRDKALNKIEELAKG